MIRLQAEWRTRALCFDTFAVLHSGLSHTPVFSAEKLTRESVLQAHGEQRSNRFYEEARLPRADRATLDDYKGSGYDRGHMAPAGDMPNENAMAQSFSLANMVPQVPENNRKAWAQVEKATRQYVKRAAGPVYVVTGPVFSDRAPTVGRNHVMVPASLYKLVFDPASNRAWAYWIDNAAGARTGPPISYAELVQRTGIDFLPEY